MNNTTYTQEQLQKRYEGLPEDLKRAIYSVETADAIQEISKKYGLMIDQMGELAAETGLLMLGFTSPKDYIKNISARAGADIDTAKKIAEEINTEIFSKVKEHLKKLHGIEEKKGAAEVGLPKAPPAVTTLELTQKHKPDESESKKTRLPGEAVSSPAPSTPPKPIFELEKIRHESPKPPASTEPLKPIESAESPKPMEKKQLDTEIFTPTISKLPEPAKQPEGKMSTTSIFSEKIQDKPFRQPIQTTEITPEKSTIKLTTDQKYPQIDPYREPLEK